MKNIITEHKRRTAGWAFISLLSLSLSLTSCSDHELADIDYAGGILQVGNILLSNNTVTTPAKFRPATDNAVGVIFYASKDTAYVIAKHELGMFCYAMQDAEISNVSTSVSLLNGKANTAALLAETKNSSPAAQATSSYDGVLTGWYLPSVAELKILSTYRNTVAASMTLIGGDAFSEEQYASSTQDGTSTANTQMYYYCVSLVNGFVTANEKTNKARVRPVLMIHN